MSVVRTVRPIWRALQDRPGVECTGIEPDPSGSLALWRQTQLPREALRSNATVLHSFVSAFPLTSRIATVQTVHEVPWAHRTRENADLAHRAWVGLGKRRAAATCTPSAGVARDLDPHPHLYVVPWGVDPAFGPEPDETDGALRGALPGLPDGPFVLALGATRRKKRLDRVCAGAALARLPVVATGPPGPASSELAASVASLVLTGAIDEAWLPALVRASGCVAVLSDSEGFALPVLEALRSGRAVVTPEGSVQSETAGGAAFDVDARDADSIASGLSAAMNASDERIAFGRAVASRYDWSRTADALVDVWRSLA